ncbi:hypothetical protein POHY109586_01455 [Polaromonas hydrogenivorans]
MGGCFKRNEACLIRPELALSGLTGQDRVLTLFDEFAGVAGLFAGLGKRNARVSSKPHISALVAHLDPQYP